MTISQEKSSLDLTQKLGTNKKKVQSSVLSGKGFQISYSDCVLVIVYLLMGIYFAVTDTYLMTILATVSAIFGLFWCWFVPSLEQYLGIQVKFRYVVIGIMTLTLLLAVIEVPAHAVFLARLEAYFKTLVAGAQSYNSGSGGTVDATAVSQVFNLIRGIFLLLVVGAAIFAYTQAQQGNDWRPIIYKIGMAFGLVIAVDIVTYIFVGSGTTAV